MRHNDSIRFRVSADLKQEIQKAAVLAGEPLSAYIRQAALAHARHRDAEVDRQLLAEIVQLREAINRVGNNLNQVTKRLHSGGSVGADFSRRLQTSIERMQAAVACILDDRRVGR